VYNVVDDDPLAVAKWMPAFARWIDTPEAHPGERRGSSEDSRGRSNIYYHTGLTDASNSAGITANSVVYV
jgi:2-alkyl-3-oxoalkanoate reductase